MVNCLSKLIDSNTFFVYTAKNDIKNAIHLAQIGNSSVVGTAVSHVNTGITINIPINIANILLVIKSSTKSLSQ